MKSVRSSRTGLIALFIGMAAPLFITENRTAQLPSPEKFSVQTKAFTGEELMRIGILPSCSQAIEEACVIELGS